MAEKKTPTATPNVDELQGRIEQLQRENEEVKEAYAALRSKYEEETAKNKVASVPTVTIGKVTKKITIPKFRHKGEVYTAEDVSNNKALAEELLAMGWGGFSD